MLNYVYMTNYTHTHIPHILRDYSLKRKKNQDLKTETSKAQQQRIYTRKIMG